MMTKLQIVLAIVGVVLIAIIVIYNLLQERRFRKEAERMFSHKREDVMLGESVRGEAGLRRSESQIHLTDDATPSPEVKQAVDAAGASLPTMDTLRRPDSGSILSSLEPIESRASDAASASLGKTASSMKPEKPPVSRPMPQTPAAPAAKPQAAPSPTPVSTPKPALAP